MNKHGDFLSVAMVMALTLFFAMPSASVGQNKIYDLDPHMSEFSIVRHYVKDVDITYSCYLSDENCFCYIDRLNGVYYKADVDLEVRVVDFRIYGDTVFFCGRYLAGRFVIGWFVINDLFFGGADINLVHAVSPIFPTDSTPYQGYDTELGGMRMKVFKERGNLHLVMVGVGCHVYTDRGNKEPGDTTDRDYSTVCSSIIDIWTNDYTSWKMKYSMDYTERMWYDDIAVTDNYVVVTAHSIDTNDNYLSPLIFYYTKPVFAMQSIFDTYSSVSPITVNGLYADNTIVSCTYGTPLLVAEIVGDTFATVCDAVVKNQNPATVVTYYKSPALPPIVRYKYGHGGQLRTYSEIKYNKYDGFLYLFRFHSNNLELIDPTASYVKNYTASGVFYSGMSMDVLNKKGFAVLTGSSAGAMKMLWEFYGFSLNGCVSEVGMVIERIDERVYKLRERQYVIDVDIRNRNITPEVNIKTMRVVCE